MELTTIVDINDICRVCLAPINTSEVSSLFFVGNNTTQLWTKIMACAWVQICDGDGLPGLICNKCHNNLEVAYNFKQQCESSDIHLRQVLGLPVAAAYLDAQQVSKRDYVQNQVTNDIQIFKSEYSPKLNNDIDHLKSISNNIQDILKSSSKRDFSHLEPICDKTCPETEVFLNSVSSHNTVTCGTQYEDIDNDCLQMTNVVDSDVTVIKSEKHSDRNKFNNANKMKLIRSKYINSNKSKPLEIYNSEDDSQDIDDIEDFLSSDENTDKEFTEELNNENNSGKKNVSKTVPPEQCELCGKVFRIKGYMAQHMRTHTGVKPHQCHVCHQKFSVYSSLVIHLRIHSGDKPFICQTCGKSFTQSAGLTAHMRSHTGERPFKCEICQKSFTQSSNLFIHRQIHSAKRDHVCPTCNKAFKFLKHLQSHMKLHTGIKEYICPVCHKEFHRKSYLNTHMSIHSGNRPYKCHICGHAFANSSNLTAHIRIHTGVKPYVCQVCKKSFAQSSALTRHMQQHSDVTQV